MGIGHVDEIGVLIHKNLRKITLIRLKSTKVIYLYICIQSVCFSGFSVTRCQCSRLVQILAVIEIPNWEAPFLNVLKVPQTILAGPYTPRQRWGPKSAPNDPGKPLHSQANVGKKVPKPFWQDIILKPSHKSD